MKNGKPLPPGQYASEVFHRFGLTQFARRFPTNTERIELRIGGDVRESCVISDELGLLPRIEQVSDFHCVTTWSRCGLRWGGVRFADVFERIIVPLAAPETDATFVVLRGQDGGRTSMPLEDLMAPDVMLADRLEGEPLPVAHGAPVRIITPGHYGYKSVKHLCQIDFWREGARYRPAGFRFMEHPRARVALEERGIGVPGILLRYLYRPLVRPTAARFRRAMEEHERG
ncbi:MAG: molybdopterin-dependent oxidoreductase [Blastocatellia bacterium]|nr:molybdopterin-dependent oxidoreductase [Blastocatellia bacterium]